jgi:hypothetical protein
MDDHKLVMIFMVFRLCKIDGKICQKITNFLGKDFLENNFGFFFILLGRTRSNTFRFGPHPVWPIDSGDALHCSFYSIVETGKCSGRRKMRKRRRRGGAGCPSGGDVWQAVKTVEAGGEMRELLGRWTTVLLIFPLFLEESSRF